LKIPTSGANSPDPAQDSQALDQKGRSVPERPFHASVRRIVRMRTEAAREAPFSSSCRYKRKDQLSRPLSFLSAACLLQLSTVFLEDLFRLEADGAPLWDGVTEIYVRPALAEEEARWQTS